VDQGAPQRGKGGAHRRGFPVIRHRHESRIELIPLELSASLD
jgi:hypothetical protein